ncbi:hypothetical protein QFZ56_001628 [Streptomyces achromogenes]|uniref:Uncharacterized protein n=1 Tax=Streptomyces achromogenes TaxID=67255 RepID=A0ABU0PYD9_STRAH|nr:hypothetical protein [Streptomyces achromogenes]
MTVTSGYLASTAVRNSLNRAKNSVGRFSSLPTSRCVRWKGLGWPIWARFLPQVEVTGPLANSMRSRVSWMWRLSSASSTTALFWPQPVTRAGTTGSGIAPTSSAKRKYS